MRSTRYSICLSSEVPLTRIPWGLDSSQLLVLHTNMSSTSCNSEVLPLWVTFIPQDYCATCPPGCISGKFQGVFRKARKIRACSFWVDAWPAWRMHLVHSSGASLSTSVPTQRHDASTVRSSPATSRRPRELRPESCSSRSTFRQSGSSRVETAFLPAGPRCLDVRTQLLGNRSRTFCLPFWRTSRPS